MGAEGLVMHSTGRGVERRGQVCPVLSLGDPARTPGVGQVATPSSPRTLRDEGKEA